MAPTLRIKRLALASALVLGTLAAWAQTTAPSLPAAPDSTAAMQPTADDIAAAWNAELFYELLVGEISAALGDHANAVALILEAARTSRSPELYARAADMAMQSRSGQHAMMVANEWQRNFPESREANRYKLHTLLALNRISETQSYLSHEIAHVAKVSKPATYLAIAQLYSRASDKVLAAAVVEQALQQDMTDAELAPAAWATVGHLRVIAGQKELARQALQHAYQQDPNAGATVLLALELLEAGVSDTEHIVENYLLQEPAPAIHLAYARVLMGLQRLADAQTQLKNLLLKHPDMSEAWLTQATLQAQSTEWGNATESLTRFFALVQQLPPSASREHAQSQAFILSARIAMQRKLYSEAIEWTDRIPDAGNDLDIQTLKALALAKQGKLAHGRAVIRAVPAQTAAKELLKRRAEVHLLQQANAPQEAYLLQRTLHEQAPNDTDIAYDTALLAERAGKLDVMETILRKIITQDSTHHHARNALGYSLAERGIRLDEARLLITEALTLAPNDPFITDSLAWVEFRQGNHAAALSLLEKAYATRNDVEIAAHLGEVLWSMGEKARARAVWGAALERDADNQTLRHTLERFGLKF